MKKIKSFLLIVFTMILSTVTIAFAEDATFKYDKATVENDAKTYLTVYGETTDEDIEYILNNNSYPRALQNGAASYKNIKDSVGKFVEITDTKIEEHGEYISVIVTGKFEKAKVCLTAEYREIFQTATLCDLSFSIADDSKLSFGERMINALLNTVMGLCLVFAVLILIAFIISLFRFIPKIQKYFTDRKERKQKKNSENSTVDTVIAQITAKEEKENLTDDLELVAVIAAAIASYEGTSTDSFVVRSINKSNRNKWRNA